MNDESFANLLEYFNLSWSGYRKVRKGVKKRIVRHMQSLGTSDIQAYLSLLDRNKEIKKHCEKLMTVSISRFFRDKHLWQALEREILPYLFSTMGESDPFRVWSCGCARGEEAYSFKILWENLQQTTQKLPELQLWATDMNENYLTMAKQARYELRSLKEIPENERGRWFEKVPGKKLFQVIASVQSAVTFKRLDFLRDAPPAKNVHLIFARNNLLTYFRSPEKEKALERIADALEPGGVLIVGSHEKIPQDFARLKRYKGVLQKCE